MRDVLVVAAGGVVGVVLRYAVMQGGWFEESKFCYTLLVNVIGCLAIGIVWSLFQHLGVRQGWYLFAITGCLGGYTTFSAFSLDAIRLIQDGMAIRALWYVVASVVLGLLACAAGVVGIDKVLGKP